MDFNRPVSVWKTEDHGNTWSVIFQAPNETGVHIHRVAVDPFTDFLWVTYGDDIKGTYYSEDEGLTWTKVREAQPTGVVFTTDAIYWGEDTNPDIGLVTRYDKQTGTFETVFNASEFGNYGGSIYDMAIGREGLLYVPLMKYPEQTHKPSLWVGDGEKWALLRSGEGGTTLTAQGFPCISHPDKDGYIYVHGYKIKDLSIAEFEKLVLARAGMVGIHGALLFAKSYGSRLGDPNWNSNADINSDGIVDICDAIMFVHVLWQ
jgi:hypothetical protein